MPLNARAVAVTASQKVHRFGRILPVVMLREITEDNRIAVEALAVTEEQSNYVAGVAWSLAEAAQHPDAKPWYRAVYADNAPVGFVMISDGITVDNPAYVGPYFLWRLLIDRRFQGSGYGTATLDLVIEHVRTRPDAQVLLTSYAVGPTSPVGFYLRYGFRLTGDVHEGEPILEFNLYPS
jgi:diamine N-acetyltransferase